MASISVIGLGSMGSALAQTLLANDYQVTVWNRTPEKAQPLVAAGATLAASPEAAINASPVTIVNIKSHVETLAVLSDCSDVLVGKTIIELSTGEATDAVNLADFLTDNGADLLVGIINAYPANVGKPDTTIITVGPKAAWDDYSPVIMTLGGQSTYIGTDPASLASLFAALFTVRQGFMFGMIYGAVVCRKAGIDMQSFADQIPVSMKVMQSYHDVFSKSVPSGQYDNPGASVDTYIAALDDALKTFNSLGVASELPQLFSDLAHRASKEGFGDKELTALVEMLS